MGKIGPSKIRLLFLSLFWLVCMAILGPILLIACYFVFRPTVAERQEIYQGIFYETTGYTDPVGGPSQVMVLEIHWDTPGIDFFIREPNLLSNGNPDEFYSLTLPTAEIIRHDLAALVNLTRYYPAEPWKSYPGAKVGSIETIVIDGNYTHLHEHSYLFWWDAEMNCRLENEKPPSKADLAKAKLGFGVQGIQIYNGSIRTGTLGDWDTNADSRTFIGVDPEKKMLWLFAFEKVTPGFMTQFAADYGVVYGAQVDSGSGTHLIAGKDAKNILPLTGIRSGRPLAAYIGIRAQPIK